MNKKGFTLVELLIVIAIIAVIVAFAAANFVGVRQRARDVKRKSEFNEMKNALRLYYNDYASYPASGTDTNTFSGCGALGASDCLSTCNGQFASGGTGCANVYMKLLPPESEYEWTYRQVPLSDDFCLWTTLENTGDPETAKSQIKCASVCTGVAPATDYVVCAD